MSSPEQQSKNEDVPPSVSVVECANTLKSPSDTISQLSQASSGARGSFSSPLKAADIGVPRTPEIRVIKPINDEANDHGYDSDGQRAPWEEGIELDFNGPEVEEDHLPVEAPSVTPEVPLAKNFEETLTTEEVQKLKVNELKRELKKRGMGCNSLKDALIKRLTEAV